MEKEYEKYIDKINEKKKELENIRNYKVMGSLVCLCFKWINEGEKLINYFLNLENCYYISKIILKIILIENNE